MGFRYRKSVKLLPGVRVNLNGKSRSITIGGRSSAVTFNDRTGVTRRVSIPGTGISYTEKIADPAPAAPKEEKYINPSVDLAVTFLLGYAGVHKFMRGQIGMGILYLCTLGLFGFGWLWDSGKALMRVLKA